MKKYLVLFIVFLFLAGLNAYLITDYIVQRVKPTGEVAGITTEIQKETAEVRDGHSNIVTPTPIQVEIIDKRKFKVTHTPTPTPTTIPESI
jgi:hypothetical protein